MFPSPLDVLRAFADLWMHQGLAQELWASFKLSAQAVVLSTAFGLAIAYSTVIPALRPAAGVFSKLRFLGLVGLTFPFTLAFGGGHGLKLALLAFGMTAFYATSMMSVVAGLSREQFDLARSLRFGGTRTVFEVVVLGTAHDALDVARQTAAMGWAMLTMVEGLVRSGGGVGALLLAENKHFDLAAVFAILTCILLVGWGQDWVLGRLRKATCPYAYLATERG